MTDLEKAARMALEALGYYEVAGLATTRVAKSITALRQALSNSVEQPAHEEPLAWYRYETVYEYRNQLARCTKDCIGAFPVYTSLQRKPWVGLTEEERKQITYRWRDGNGTASEILDMVEAKLKDKNGY